jgi:GTP-binding protein HflX
LTLPSRRRVLLSDTVGFIRNLPTTLVKAFRATLEEVTDAAIVLHAVDVSSPVAVEHTGHVLQVLSEIGAAEIPQILIMNKMDRLPEAERDAEALGRRLLGDVTAPGTHPHPVRAVGISALTGEGIDELLAVMDQVLRLDPIVRTTLHLPVSDGAALAMLHEFGRVLATRYGEDGAEVEVEVEIPESVSRRFNL